MSIELPMRLDSAGLRAWAEKIIVQLKLIEALGTIGNLAYRDSLLEDRAREIAVILFIVTNGYDALASATSDVIQRQTNIRRLLQLGVELTDRAQQPRRSRRVLAPERLGRRRRREATPFAEIQSVVAGIYRYVTGLTEADIEVPYPVSSELFWSMDRTLSFVNRYAAASVYDCACDAKLYPLILRNGRCCEQCGGGDRILSVAHKIPFGLAYPNVDGERLHWIENLRLLCLQCIDDDNADMKRYGEKLAREMFSEHELTYALESVVRRTASSPIGWRRPYYSSRPALLRGDINYWDDSYNAALYDDPNAMTRIEWQDIIIRQEGRCALCERHLALTADHIVPRSKGGDNTAANIQGLCMPCNSRKGTKAWDKVLRNR